LGRPHEVLDVVEVDAGEVRAPRRHGLAFEEAQRLETALEHPLRLLLEGGDVPDDVLAEAALGRLAGGVLVVPAVLVGADRLELGVELEDPVGLGGVGRREPPCLGSVLCSPMRGRVSADVGMWVVQTCAPPARVDRRRTSTPRYSPNTSSSASQNSGDRKSTRLNSSHVSISYAVFFLKKKTTIFIAEIVITSENNIIV